MGAKYTEAQKAASAKYLKDKTDDVRVRVPKGTKARWAAAAAAQGFPSLQRFIIDTVEAAVEPLDAKKPEA